jgi:DNA-binding transcriptional regulator YiaG
MASLQLLSPNEIWTARQALGLTVREFAQAVGLSSKNGPDRMADWEQGRIPITGVASQCIRFMLAAHGLGPMPGKGEAE